MHSEKCLAEKWKQSLLNRQLYKVGSLSIGPSFKQSVSCLNPLPWNIDCFLFLYTVCCMSSPL